MILFGDGFAIVCLDWLGFLLVLTDCVCFDCGGRLVLVFDLAGWFAVCCVVWRCEVGCFGRLAFGFLVVVDDVIVFGVILSCLWWLNW